MVQDLPEVPTSVPEEINEKLDLPDVIAKAPVASTEASANRKGMSVSLSSMPSPQNPPAQKETGKKLQLIVYDGCCNSSGGTIASLKNSVTKISTNLQTWQSIWPLDLPVPSQILYQLFM